MTALIASVFFFGLIHPGSKWVLDSGLPFFPFLTLYILIRILVQAPLVIQKKALSIGSREKLSLLVSLGCAGAALHFFEFKGIQEGLPVSLVSFLLYSYPLWILLFAKLLNGESLTMHSLLKALLALFGIFLLAGTQISDFGQIERLWAPLLASVFIALWIVLSNRTKKSGLSTLTISFYYDLFALGAILIAMASHSHAPEWKLALDWLSNPPYLLMIILYSILTGLVPNLLFYHAARTVTAVTAGLVLLFEPIISSIIAMIAWDEEVSARFLMGALLIVLANFRKGRIVDSNCHS